MHTIISNGFTEKYNIVHPVVSAGMAFAAGTAQLATAVCRAGGVGSIGVGPMRPAQLQKVIQELKLNTEKPFHVNFITAFTSKDHLAVCIEEKVPIVSFHFGHPAMEFIQILKDAGIKVWEQVGSVESACIAENDGIDLIIVQGIEAGGHNFATLPIFVLLPEVVRKVKHCQVLAAGGITTGGQIAAALCMGAVGVSIGTRLVASTEAFVRQDYKEQIVDGNGIHTVLSSAFGPEMPWFNPMRVIRNKIVDLSEQADQKHQPLLKVKTEAQIGSTVLDGKKIPLFRYTNFPPTPETEGAVEELPLPAGQGIGLINGIEDAEVIIANMMIEAGDVFKRFRII